MKQEKHAIGVSNSGCCVCGKEKTVKQIYEDGTEKRFSSFVQYRDEPYCSVDCLLKSIGAEQITAEIVE
ncbi:MAG: hypothetical protein ACRCZB_04955 [Bacteroidales bacterium]